MKKNFSFSTVAFADSERIVDTHCHYNLSPLYESWQEHWRVAQEHGVISSIIPGTDLESSQRAVEISGQEETLWALVGIHPGSVLEMVQEGVTVETVLARLESWLSSGKVLGVGEIGLDYFRLKLDDQAEPERERQRVWFRAQLELAKKYGVPVALHVRDREIPETATTGNAYWDVLGIMEELAFSNEFVLHCVSGPSVYVQAMVERGAFIGIAANVTYPNAQHIRDLVKLAPVERILLETDAPYLPPQEHRGEVCEPWMIRLTAEFLESAR